MRSLVYNSGEPIAEPDRVIRTAHAYVAEDGADIVGSYNVLDLTCTCRGANLKCGGIAAVAVHPKARAGGVGSAMMRHAVRQMREQGVPMASLYGYREWFYRKFGFETCGRRYELIAPTHRVPLLPAELPIRDLAQADWREVNACYEAFAMARNGMTMRDEFLWHRVVSEKHTIYAAGDPVEAYAILRHEVDFWKAQNVREIAWSTARGYRTILGLMAGLGVNKTAVEWYEPGDSPFVATYLDQGVDIKLSRLVMYRCNDVPAALAALRPRGSGSFTLEVLDDLIPENRGPWRVAFGPSGVEVSSASDAALVMSVQGFVQALLGQPSLHDLAINQLVDVRSAAALEAAETLLSPASVYCLEFF